MPAEKRSPSAVPSGLPVLGAGAHRDARSGSCVMEYVSVLAGEPFSDRPRCTHPAVAALAWQVNDAVSHDVRQQLVLRAPDLVGAGRGHDAAVRPVVLGAVLALGRELAPGHRFFQRLGARLARDAERGPGGPDGRGGRLATLLHVGPVNHACAHLVVAARAAGLSGAQRDRLLLRLLDETLVAVRAAAPRPEPAAHPAPSGA